MTKEVKNLREFKTTSDFQKFDQIPCERDRSSAHISRLTRKEAKARTIYKMFSKYVNDALARKLCVTLLDEILYTK